MGALATSPTFRGAVTLDVSSVHPAETDMITVDVYRSLSPETLELYFDEPTPFDRAYFPELEE